jgi:hypothetical protein
MKKIVLLYIYLFSFLSAYTQDLEWLQQLKGASNNDLTALNQIQMDEEGNMYLLGHFSDTINFDLKKGSHIVIPKRNDLRTIFLAKYDSNKNFIWVKTFDPNHELIKESNYFDVTFKIVDHQNVLFGITFENRIFMNEDSIKITSKGFRDFVLVKLDKDGDIIWHKTYGSKKEDEIFRGILYEKNRYVIHGTYGDTMDFGQLDRFGKVLYSGYKSENFYLASIDTLGNTQWVKTLKSSLNFKVRNIKSFKDGSMVIIGWYRDTFYLSDSTFIKTSLKANFNNFIIKFSKDGDILWSKNLECNDHRNSLYGLDIDKEDNIYASGYYTGEVLLKNGNNVFRKYNLKKYNLLLMKLDINGIFLWSKHIEGGAINNSVHCELAVSDQISLAGEYADSLVFDEGNEKWMLKSHNRVNGFIAFLDLNGKLKTASTYKVGNPLSIIGSSYITDIMERDNQVYIIGFFAAKVDFSPTQNKSIMDAKESQFNGFIAKYSKRIIPKDSLVNSPETLPNIGIKDSRHQHFSIYPNPFTDKIYIDNPKSEKFSAQLTDLQGKTIAKSQTISSKSYTLELDKNLPKGLYFLEIKTESETSFHKVLNVE